MWFFLFQRPLGAPIPIQGTKVVVLPVLLIGLVVLLWALGSGYLAAAAAAAAAASMSHSPCPLFSPQGATGILYNLPLVWG
jgi:hypothetical protein